MLMLLLSLMGGSLATAASGPCTEIYFEAAHLNRVDTQTGFLYAKTGYCVESLNIGLVTRVGADTRTASDSSNFIFNDNFFFIGGGLSYLDPIPGVRLIAEGGYSFDLSSKIKRQGADFRVGWMSYHEALMPLPDLKMELYSEGIYVRRYLNFLFSLQPRLFYGVINPSNELTIGPLLGLGWSYDSEKFDYNRFVEFNYGVKAKIYQVLGAQVYGVRGFRTNANSSLPAYSDFRILLFGYFSMN